MIVGVWGFGSIHVSVLMSYSLLVLLVLLIAVHSFILVYSFIHSFQTGVNSMLSIIAPASHVEFSFEY